jgi:hypothetical protein
VHGEESGVVDSYEVDFECEGGWFWWIVEWRKAGEGVFA